ncbi:MAG: DUF397 domain-containing protein [Saccharothrix sp.]|nr:DUF397 domain-containing protein [Saccharothrix sp.]
MDAEGLRWAKGSASGGGGNNSCVEIAKQDDDVVVRSSRNRAGTRLSYTSLEWASFLAWLRHNG